MEQKFKSFLIKYNGTFVEKVDAGNLNQCFDLCIAFTEWLGLPLNIFAGLMYAYQIWSPSTQIAADNFEYLLNSSDAVPQIGDIVVFAKAFNGTAGHVVICNGETQVQGQTNDWFRAFSQNDPAGSSSIIKTYGFNHVLGWLRFKGLLPTDPLQECLRQHQPLVNECNEKGLQIKSLNETMGNLNDQITQLAKDKNSLADNLKQCQIECSGYKDQTDKLIPLTQERDQLKQDLVKLKGEFGLSEQNYIKRIKYLETRLVAFKSPTKKLIVDIWEKFLNKI